MDKCLFCDEPTANKRKQRESRCGQYLGHSGVHPHPFRLSTIHPCGLHPARHTLIHSPKCAHLFLNLPTQLSQLVAYVGVFGNQ